MTKESKIILGIILVALVGIIGLVTFVNRGATDSTAVANRLVRENSNTLGTGAVQIVEFGDYQCPACAQAHPTTKQLMEEYDGRVSFVFRNFPLPMHPNAQAAAEAAEAAGAQGKFWEMHDKLFESQNQWGGLADPTDIFVSYASELALDTERFRSDVSEQANEDKIMQDESDGYALGITGTPTFYVNGGRQSSFDYNSLKSAIDAAL